MAHIIWKIFYSLIGNLGLRRLLTNELGFSDLRIFNPCIEDFLIFELLSRESGFWGFFTHGILFELLMLFLVIIFSRSQGFLFQEFF